MNYSTSNNFTFKLNTNITQTNFYVGRDETYSDVIPPPPDESFFLTLAGPPLLLLNGQEMLLLQG